MVLWCKKCNALMGLGPPLEDWSTNHQNFCKECSTEHINGMNVTPEAEPETILFESKPESESASI